MAWCWIFGAVALLAVSCICRGDGGARASDSLRGALDAISRRQRDLADPPTSFYYLHSQRDGDGQPEDIGYGYHKTLVPKVGGVFEAMPLPGSELERHDPREDSHFPEGKALENLIIDYIEDNIGIDPSKYQYNKNLNLKRSVFRERDIHELPDDLQNLYLGNDYSSPNYDNGEHSIGIPSPYKEKSSKPLIKYSAQNAGLVRNFGGLDRDTDNYPGNDDEPDEYLSVLNSVWDKYQDSNSDNFDPEDLSEQDTENILSYINHNEKQQQNEHNSENGYGFFNSPLVHVKRNRQRFKDNSAQHQNINSLKFLNGPSDKLELFKEEYMLDENKDKDDAKLLLENRIPLKNNQRYKKRFWHGNTYDEQHLNVAKRYPIAKRSSYYTNPAVLYHKNVADKINQRKKKNINNHVSDETTDPKVALELSDIFSSPKNLHNVKEDQNTTEHSKLNKVSKDKLLIKQMVNEGNNSKTLPNQKTNTHVNDSHSFKKRSGQKEESDIQFQNNPIGKAKKAVNWSNYFGIDKRNTKSTNQQPRDEWLLDQYLKAYSISTRELKEPSLNQMENSEVQINMKNSDDMDAKLRAMEDIIVDQALKYTGAHEGITDSEEVQAVKDRVIAQLAAAYSLEKMRKALSEFKYSIAAQKASPSTHTTTHGPTELPEPKNKRVAVKKEHAVSQERKHEMNEDLDNAVNLFNPSGHYPLTGWNNEGSCPVMEEIAEQCKVVSNIAGDRMNVLVPLCIWYQVCSLCGPEMGELASGCDMNFVTEANKKCGDSGRCRYVVHRAVAAMNSDSLPRTCDWQANPCLARYLASTKR